MPVPSAKRNANFSSMAWFDWYRASEIVDPMTRFQEVRGVFGHLYHLFGSDGRFQGISRKKALSSKVTFL